MIHSRQNKNVDILIYVQPSRFKKILSDIRCYNGLYVEGFIEQVCKDYNYFQFVSTDIGDKNGNTYTVVKTFEVHDDFSKCKGCDCNRKRWINAKTGVCFYKEDINNNYVTKIPIYE